MKYTLLFAAVIALVGCDNKMSQDVPSANEDFERSSNTMSSSVEGVEKMSSTEEKETIKRNVSEFDFNFPEIYKNDEIHAGIVEYQKEHYYRQIGEIESSIGDEINFTLTGGYTDTVANRIILFYFISNNTDKSIESISFTQDFTFETAGIKEDFTNSISITKDELGVIPAKTITPLFVDIYPKTKLSKEVENFYNGEHFKSLEIKNIIVHYSEKNK